MALLLLLLSLLNSVAVRSFPIDLLECEPPDFPKFGGYGPKNNFYDPGDTIHYYCDVTTFMSGNFYRICEDSGDWSGDTPFCDPPMTFTSINQSSTATPEDDNSAENAADGLRNTCTSTVGGESEYWFGKFLTSGELIRVMIFPHKVSTNVAYEVLMVKENGEELSCGTNRGPIDQLTWEFHMCPGEHNKNVKGIKIKSLSSSPLQICEIAAYVITTPTCVDPHVWILNGRLQLNRTRASLVCDLGYSSSLDSSLECVRNGQWNRKILVCTETELELNLETERTTNRTASYDGQRVP